MKPDFKNLLLCIASVLLALVLAEALLWVLPLPDFRVLSTFKNPPWQSWADHDWSNPGPKAYRRHRVIGYEHALRADSTVPLAGHSRGEFRFRTNNLGLRRNSDTAVQKPSDLFRILLLGDSQTDGYVNNEESFSAHLESHLSAQKDYLGKRVEVLNAGVVGYSPAQEFLWYNFRGARLKPDLVILIFYAGNDVVELRDPSKPTVNTNTGQAISAREGDPSEGVFGPGRFAHSGPLDKIRLVALACYTIRAGPLSKFWRKFRLPGHLTEAGGFEMNALIQVLRTCHGCFWQYLRQAAYARRNPQGIRTDLRRTEDILIRLSRDVEANGGRLAVAVLPSRVQVEPARARQELYNAAVMLGADEFDLAFEDHLTSVLIKHLTGNGLPAFSLQEPLSTAARVEPVYYSRDWHLNVRGNQVVASALVQALQKLQLLPDLIQLEQ